MSNITKGTGSSFNLYRMRTNILIINSNSQIDYHFYHSKQSEDSYTRSYVSTWNNLKTFKHPESIDKLFIWLKKSFNLPDRIGARWFIITTRVHRCRIVEAYKQGLYSQDHRIHNNLGRISYSTKDNIPVCLFME